MITKMNLPNNLNLAPVLLLSLAYAAGTGFSLVTVNEKEDTASSGLQWDNTITIHKNGAQVDQFHNELTGQGKELIAGKLFNSSASNTQTVASNFTYISLGNGTTVEPDDTTLDSQIEDFGLSPAKASSIESSNVGTYTLKKKFTAALRTDQSIKVNTTGLNYGTGTGKLVSGGSFTSATLKDGDQITVTHEITISGGGS